MFKLKIDIEKEIARAEEQIEREAEVPEERTSAQ